MSDPSVTVVGLGCIGGSLVRALAANGIAVRGWSTSLEDRRLATYAGFDASPESLFTAVEGASLVVIAVPIGAMPDVATTVTRAASDSAFIVHCCGAQSQATLGEDDATFARVLGAHPIAGSHESGFRASRADLFAGCTVSIESRAPDTLRDTLTWFWRLADVERLEYRSAADHDAMMAWVSHLPQLAAMALAATLAAGHVDPRSTGPGARDSTRLAASSFDQWAGLLAAAPTQLDSALSHLEQTIARVRAALAAGDSTALKDIWEAAREWRRTAEPRA